MGDGAMERYSDRAMGDRAMGDRAIRVDAINRGLSKTARGVSERYSTTIWLFGVNDSTGGKRTGQDDVTVN
jgi:hypothetical protein